MTAVAEHMRGRHRRSRERSLGQVLFLTTGSVVLGLSALLAAHWLDRLLLAPVALAVVFAAPFLLRRPAVCLVLAVVVQFSNLPGVAAQNGVPGVYILTLGMATAAAAVAVWQKELRPGWSPVLLAMLLVVAVQFLAAVVGRSLSSSFTVVEETAKTVVWLVVLTTLLLIPGPTPRAVARAVVGTLAALSALIVLQVFVFDDSTTFAGFANTPLAPELGSAARRHAGPQLDSNFWGRVLILGLPFALSLAQVAESRVRRACWIGTALLIGSGIVFTGSRGALVAMLVVPCVWALLAGGRPRRALLVAPVLIGLALAIPGIGSRLMTLSSLGSSPDVVGTDPSLVGRLAAQELGWRMVVDHPFLGVGPGNFLLAEPYYLLRSHFDTIAIEPHNLYLEVAAESGLLGLATWLTLLGSVVVVAWRARVLLRAGPGRLDESSVALSTAVIAAVVGWGIASLFLHLATLQSFLVVAALAAALDIRARRVCRDALQDRVPSTGAPPSPKGGPEVVTVSGDRRPRVAALLAAAVFLGVASGGAVLAGTQQAWSASDGLRLVVKDRSGSIPSVPAATPYELSVLTRPELVSTLAMIAADPRVVTEGLGQLDMDPEVRDDISVTVSNSSPSGFITITAVAPSPADAQAAAESVRAVGDAYLDSLSRLYGVEAVGSPLTVKQVDNSYLRVVALFGVALAVACLQGAWRLHRKTGEDQPAPQSPGRTSSRSAPVLGKVDS